MNEPIAFFKVTFTYDSNREGRAVWRQEIKIFDATNAEELNKKIEQYIKSDFPEYRRGMKMIDVTSL